MLEKGSQMVRAAAYLKEGKTGWWTIKFCYMQREILQWAQPLLENGRSTCLDVKGTEYIPSVTQEKQDLGIKCFFKYFLGFWP